MKKIIMLNLLICLLMINISSAQTVGKNETQGKEDTSQHDMDYSGRGIKEIPKEVFIMTELKQLDLSNNKLSVLPSEIKNLKTLTVLKLNGNEIYELPAAIQKLKFLKEIYLDRNIWQYRTQEVKNLTSARIILVD